MKTPNEYEIERVASDAVTGAIHTALGHDRKPEPVAADPASADYHDAVARLVAPLRSVAARMPLTSGEYQGKE